VTPDPPIRKTCKRFNVAGHAHFLTFSCFHRRPFLARDRSRGWMIDAIALAREQHLFDLWAWVIMPEHVHTLIFPRRRQYSISAILTTMKQSVSKRATHFVRTEAPQFIASMTDRQPNGSEALRFWERGAGRGELGMHVLSGDSMHGGDAAAGAGVSRRAGEPCPRPRCSPGSESHRERVATPPATRAVADA
jgi:REP element-mobilizing transposase RayT